MQHDCQGRMGVTCNVFLFSRTSSAIAAISPIYDITDSESNANAIHLDDESLNYNTKLECDKQMLSKSSNSIFLVFTLFI